MALNFGNQPTAFEQFEKREFTRSDSAIVMKPITEGNAVLFTFDLVGGIIGRGAVNYMGTQVIISIDNQTGASRNITIVVTNLTKSTTLFSSNVDLNDESQGFTQFYSLEKVSPGDTIRIEFGNEGAGTANGSTTLGYYFVELKGVFTAEDESS